MSANSMHMIFCHVSKILLANFKKTIHGFSGSRELSRDLSTEGKRKFAIFEVFRAYLEEFSIFFRDIYMVARSYQALAADIKSLLVTALVSLETRLKVPILAIFDDLGSFSSCLFS